MSIFTRLAVAATLLITAGLAAFSGNTVEAVSPSESPAPLMSEVPDSELMCKDADCMAECAAEGLECLADCDDDDLKCATRCNTETTRCYKKC
jgi:hypothetical protein